MKNEFQVPEVICISDDPAIVADAPANRLLSALEAFPTRVIHPSRIWEVGNKSEVHIHIVPMEHLTAFLDETRKKNPDHKILASTILWSARPLQAIEKVQWFEKGVAHFIEPGAGKDEILRKVTQLLEGRSRLVASKMLNERARFQTHDAELQFRSQREFLQMAVHDLRSPLSAMVCYAELLMEGVLGNLERSQLEPIRTIHRNCQFLIDMVTDLLDSARIEEGKLQLKLEKTDFVHQVELAVDSLKGLADSKSIRIELISSELPQMYLDIQKFGRIITNLLGNAI